MSVEALKTYNKYIDLIKQGLMIIPDMILSNTITSLTKVRNEKPYIPAGETHEVMLNAKKVQITSRGSLRTIAIDGIHYDSVEQAACSMYDPYDEYFDIVNDVRSNILEFSFVPILDTKRDAVRYTISKYSKGLRKYFDPHKVIKAVYSIDNVLFYVKDEDDVKRKYYFKIGSINSNDMMPYFCKAASDKNGLESNIYLAFYMKEYDLPFTYGTCKDDFYLLKDILNRISFMGSTPLKYMIFKELLESNLTTLKAKEVLAYDMAINLTNTNKKTLGNNLNLDNNSLNELLNGEKLEVLSNDGKKVNKHHISKFLNILDNIHELRFYEKENLMWKVKYDEIPD